MPNWLTKSTGGSSPQAGDAPQTFRLTCECSEQHTGQRKTRPQRIVCQSCGTALFVLPKNVYPVLKERPTRKKRSRKRPSGQNVGGRRVPSANQLASSVRSGLVGAASGVGRGVGTVASTTGRKVSSTAKAAGRSVRSSLTPFRLIALAISAMLLGTAVVAWRSHALESARETFRAQFEAGQEAWTSDELVAARDHFALAAQAADTLGSDDAPAREARRWHQETVAMTNLAPESLLDMLAEAEDYRSRDGGLSWADVFGTRFEGRWIVMHAPVRSGPTGMVVDVPIAVGQEQTPAIVRVDLPHVDALPSVDGSTVTVFAAPLAGCERDDAGNEWIVTLDSEAGFLWSHVEGLRSLGFFASEWINEADVTSLLEAQTPLTGAAP